MPVTQDSLYFSVSTPLGKDKLLLRGFSGSEGISELFSFELEMESETPDLDFSQVVGKTATITVLLADAHQPLHQRDRPALRAGRLAAAASPATGLPWCRRCGF